MEIERDIQRKWALGSFRRIKFLLPFKKNVFLSFENVPFDSGKLLP